MSNEKMNIQPISIEKLKENPWNPNEMDDDTFNRLADELSDTGYIDPIQVVPQDDGMYMIIGGEHRWRAMKALGEESMECIILDDDKFSDKGLQKFVTMRLNAIKGKINPKKFMDLYNDLSNEYEAEALQALMGVTDDSEWKAMTSEIRKSLKESGMSKEAIKRFDEVTKELKTVDELSVILHDLFNEYGDTLEYNFMYFTFGTKDHLYVRCSKDTFKKVKGMMSKVGAARADADVVFGQLLDGWEDVVELEPMEREVSGEEDREETQG